MTRVSFCVVTFLARSVVLTKDVRFERGRLVPFIRVDTTYRNSVFVFCNIFTCNVNHGYIFNSLRISRDVVLKETKHVKLFVFLIASYHVGNVDF